MPADEVLPTALAIAHEIATQTAPSAVALTKRLAYEMLAETDREAAFHREWELFRWMGRQPDSAEGVASFVEKRPPQFPSGKDRRAAADRASCGRRSMTEAAASSRRRCSTTSTTKVSWCSR